MRKLARLLYWVVLGGAVLGLLLSAPALAAGREVDVTLKDLAFVPNQLSVTAGEQVHFVLKNIGALPHNFSSPDLGINQDVLPGQTKEFDFTVPDKPGAYGFFCNQPGHKEAGMQGSITVAAAPIAAKTPAAVGAASSAAGAAGSPAKLPNTGDGSLAGRSDAWPWAGAVVVLLGLLGGTLFWRHRAGEH